MMSDHKQIQALLVTYSELDGAMRRQVDEHLATCPDCAAILATHHQTDQALRSLTARKEQYLRQQPSWSTNTLPVRVRQAMQRQRAPQRDNMFFRLSRLRAPILQATSAGALLLLLGLLVISFSNRRSMVESVRAATPTGIAPTLTLVPTATAESAIIRLLLPESEPVAQQTTIRFAVNRWDEGNYLPLVYEFEAANPDLQIELVTLEKILNDNDVGWLGANFSAVTAVADVISAYVDQSAIEAGLVRDLRPFIQADISFHEQDYYPNALTTYEWQGGLWALPATLDVALIFYDKDAFDGANVAYPQAGWTLDDFIATAKAVAIRKGDAVVRWGFVESWYSPQQFIESQAGPLFDARTTPLTSRLLHPEVLSALRQYSELYTIHRVSPSQEQPTGDSFGPSPLIRMAAMWSSNLAAWNSPYDDRRLGVVPYPINSKRSHTSQVNAFPTIALSAQSRHSEAAWRWMSFLSTKLTEPYTKGNFLPARKSVAEAIGLWDKMDPELATALRYALDHSYAPHYAYPALNSVEVWEALDTAFTAILLGQKPVDVAMAEVQAVAQRQLLVATDPPSAQCQITTPAEGATVNEIVTLQGMATSPDFAYYQIFYAPGHSASESLNFLLQESQPVQNSELGRFDSTVVPDGPYTLSLRVVDQSSNYAECLVHIVVEQPVSTIINPSPARCLEKGAVITTPAEGATISGTVTLRGTATDPAFAYYHVHYVPSEANQEWVFLFGEGQPVQNGELGRFDSTFIPNGPATLSLRVVDQTGNYHACLVNVTVHN